MPIPVPEPPAVVAGPAAMYHLPDPQGFAIDQERWRHGDALYHWGEYALFIVMWKVEDFEAGRVARCPTCYAGAGAIIADAYGQATQDDCPDCFGTTFDGGWKAKLVRQSLWDFTLPDVSETARGISARSAATIQTPDDFRMASGDYAVRADNTRWRVDVVGTNHYRTGFDLPDTPRTNLGFNYGQATLQPLSSPVYSIPPVDESVLAILDVAHAHLPVDWSAIEVVRGPVA